MDPDGTIAPLAPQTVAETNHNISLFPYPPSIPSNAPWVSVPITPTSSFPTLASPSHSLGAGTSQPFLSNLTTNSVNQIPQYGSIAPPADGFNNPHRPENFSGEEASGGTVDPRLLFSQPTQPTLTYMNETNVVTNVETSMEYNNLEDSGWSYDFESGF